MRLFLQELNMQNNQIPLYSTFQPSMSYRLRHSKALVAIVAVLGVTVMALAAAMVVNRSDAQQGVPVATATAPAKLAADTSKSSSANTTNTVKRTTAPAVAPKTTVAAVCADCGTVQSVTAVQRQGQVNGVPVGNTTIGLGTVAGGVIGGLLGNQVGNGNGKTLATVVGAAGGAYAGNTVEKNMKKVTVYDVRVRMDDGSIRNMDISTAVPVGSKVIVEGKNLRLATSNG
jgi:outer membrane lipoprotein SlyB